MHEMASEKKTTHARNSEYGRRRHVHRRRRGHHLHRAHSLSRFPISRFPGRVPGKTAAVRRYRASERRSSAADNSKFAYGIRIFVPEKARICERY